MDAYQVFSILTEFDVIVIGIVGKVKAINAIHIREGLFIQTWLSEKLPMHANPEFQVTIVSPPEIAVIAVYDLSILLTGLSFMGAVAIRKSRQEVLNHSRETLSDDPSQLLKIKSQSVLISVQNILRSVKIELRPVLNRKEEESRDELHLPELKDFITSEVSDLNTYCLEPTYFKSWELFKEVARYRYILDKTVKNWPSSP